MVWDPISKVFIHYAETLNGMTIVKIHTWPQIAGNAYTETFGFMVFEVNVPSWCMSILCTRHFENVKSQSANGWYNFVSWMVCSRDILFYDCILWGLHVWSDRYLPSVVSEMVATAFSLFYVYFISSFQLFRIILWRPKPGTLQSENVTHLLLSPFSSHLCPKNRCFRMYECWYVHLIKILPTAQDMYWPTWRYNRLHVDVV